MKRWVLVGLVVSIAWGAPPPESKEQQAIRVAKSAGTWNGISYVSMDLRELEQLFWKDFKSQGIPLIKRAGIWVLAVEDDSPADKAGFAAGDVMVRIGGERITDAGDFVAWQRGAVVGESYAIHIWRIQVKDSRATWGRKILHLAPTSATGGTMEDMVAQVTGKSTGGFRGVPWGSNLAAVRDREVGEGEIVQGVLMYEGDVAGMEAVVGYVFADNKLARGGYVFTESHSNKNEYLEDYSRLQGLIEKKYGPPSDTDVDWKNDLYADDQAQFGFAVSLGHLAFLTTWELKDATVHLGLSGDNFEIKLQLDYTSRVHGHLIEQQNEQQALDDL